MARTRLEQSVDILARLNHARWKGDAAVVSQLEHELHVRDEWYGYYRRRGRLSPPPPPDLAT